MKKLVLLFLFAVVMPVQAQQHDHAKSSGQPIIFAADAIQWMAGPPTLPAGAKIAVLQGDPSQPGPFVIRITFPANTEVKPHYHPSDEHVTILSGTFSVGMGSTFDKKATTTFQPGSFAVLPAQMHHFAFTDQGVMLQIHGTGPFKLIYVNPADDPSKK